VEVNSLDCDKPMTICIGVICDNGKKAVVAADRMITAEHLSIEFESEDAKIIQLTDKVVAMTAGDALIHTEVFGAAKAKIDTSITLVSQVAEKVKEAFVEERKKRFEEEALKPRGLTLVEFYGGAHRTLDPNIIMRLDRQLEDSRLDLQILIAGVDQNGAHLYHLVDPGTAQCFDSLGFAGIGSGYPHAMSVFIYNHFNPRMDLNKAVYLVYEAKRRSESAPGVGKEYIDIAIIGSKIRFLSATELDQLKKIYDAKIRLEKPPEIEEMIKSLRWEEG
jgi:20S proteasome alpha/beta subunit